MGSEMCIRDRFTGKTEIDGESNLSIDRLAFLVCRGGWPQSVDMRDEIALDQAMDYYDAVVHADINRADNVQKTRKGFVDSCVLMHEIREDKFQIP